RNTGTSIKKGDPVIVTGRLKVRPWEAGEKKGVSIEVDAESLGHDLPWGTTTYTRALRAADVSSGNPPTDSDPNASDTNDSDPSDSGPAVDSEGSAFPSAAAQSNSNSIENAVPTPF